MGTDDAVRLSGIWCTPPASIQQAGLREVIRLRWLIPRADALAESQMESRKRWRFLDAHLPAPAYQVRVGDLGERWHRFDTGWRDHRVGAEFDGGIAHLTQQQLRADRDRHNWLTENGWTLLHFTDIDVYRRHTRMIAEGF
ncbi:MAG: endonuclease domain-containing protein [Actinomycetota bacterium]|nr:endonuclease domain-containing protein [Actinomycetota bacterium]